MFFLNLILALPLLLSLRCFNSRYIIFYFLLICFAAFNIDLLDIFISVLSIQIPAASPSIDLPKEIKKITFLAHLRVLFATK